MRKLIGTLSYIAILSGTGCGTQLGDPMPPTSNQKSAATQLTNTVDQIAKISANPENAFGLYGVMAAIGPMAVDPTAKRQNGLFLRETKPGSGGHSPLDLSPAGCVTGTAATGLTYNNCASGGTTVNGTIKIASGQTDINLQIKASSNTAGVQISLVGSVKNDGMRMTGNMVYEMKLDLGGLGGLAGGAGNQKTTVAYDMTYSTNPYCITGGSIRVDTESAAGKGAAQFEWTGCNMYTVRNGST